MTVRHYSNTGSDAEVSVLINSSVTTVTLANFTGFPSVPYIAAIDPDTVDEEVVLVTAVAGAAATITRGYDGTTAKTHAAGAQFRHVASAKDFEEANTHVNATSAAHGVAGTLVGTSDTQTLTNKTITTPTISAPTVTGTLAGAAATFSGAVTIASGSIAALAAGNTAITGTLSVSGTATMAAINAAAISGTTGAFSGAVTVGGTLGVTGAATGTSLTLSGALVALSSTVTTVIPTEIELVQNASDLTPAASRSSLFARTDFGLYFTPNSQTRRRVQMHWGSGTTNPTTGALSGDTFYDSDLASMMRYNGSTWRQIDVIQIANMAARPAGGNLHAGFRVFSLADDDEYFYDGTYWRNSATLGMVPSGAGAGDYITGLGGTTSQNLNGSGVAIISLGHSFSAAPVFALVTPGAVGGNLRTCVPESTDHTASAIHVFCYNSAANLISGTGAVRLNWHVIGYNN